MNSYRSLWEKLLPFYDENEAKAIIRTVLEVRYGMTLTDVLCDKVSELSTHERHALQKIMDRLTHGEPVQYVLGKTCFAGRTFHVGPGVLIPRPETEGLCQWIISSSEDHPAHPAILDIGTGSGCIAITLALGIPQAKVSAWDISDRALEIAKDNASALKAQVCFEQQDILSAPKDAMRWDTIVSNPPYICPSEATDMERHVLEHEPDSALFTPGGRPLFFYQAIAEYALHALKPKGSLYLEINPRYAESLHKMLTAYGLTTIETRKDQFGKKRMMKAVRPF